MLKAITLLVVFSTVILLSLTLHEMNKKVTVLAGLASPKLCGDKYVVAQNKCLEGNPGNTAGCFSKNSWSATAQKCIDNVDRECQQNCRPEDCPAYLKTPIDPGCSPC